MKRVSLERAAALADALKEIEPRAVDVIEYNDPQFRAVSRIARLYGPSGVAIVVANALVSYRLSVTGEEYWTRLAEAVEEKKPEITGRGIVEFFSRFLGPGSGNVMMVGQKLARVRRVAPLLEQIVSEPLRYADLDKLHEALKAALQARGDEKTIVFAVKMAYYYYRALGVEPRGGDSIPIPVDRRVALLTSTSRLIEAGPAAIMSRYRREAVEAWREVSRRAGVSMIRLDAVIWLPARGVETLLRRSLGYAREEYARRLVALSMQLIPWSVASRVAREILYLPPPSE